ncbi:SDR family oxidoreductase [Pseudomonas sp. S2_H01]
MSTLRNALVVGSSGIIGSAVVNSLVADARWTVHSLRRNPDPLNRAIHCDLADEQDTLNALAHSGHISHVFYAALKPEKNALVEAQTNAKMLLNVLNGLKAAGANLQRVVLYQGAKVYGGHLGGPVPTPFYEDASRHLPANFYFAQEDVLRKKQQDGEFDWAILRPDAVLGDVPGAPYNIALVIGVYAALCKEAGVPLKFPGSLYTYSGMYAQLTDVRWLGQASIWAATADNARNEAFNLVGEPFRWNYLWKKLAAAMDMAIDEPQPMSLSTHMPDQAEAWLGLVKKHGLDTLRYDRLVNWGFGDFVFNIQQDLLSDMGKIRRAGFTEPMNTESALLDMIQSLKTQRVLP